jgi:hypothetical protein
MAKLVTTNLRFPERLWKEIRLQAVRRRTTAAGIVREAVETYLGRRSAAAAKPDTDPFDRHVGAIGGSAGDESVNHDHYLYGWPKEDDREAPGGLERAPRARPAAGSKPSRGKGVRRKAPRRAVRPD